MKTTFGEVWDELSLNEKLILVDALKVPMPILALSRINSLRKLGLNKECVCAYCRLAVKLQKAHPTEEIIT